MEIKIPDIESPTNGKELRISGKLPEDLALQTLFFRSCRSQGGCRAGAVLMGLRGASFHAALPVVIALMKRHPYHRSRRNLHAVVLNPS
ncbi:hypothetical protein [Noviherbaspirillum pedocola]|uniref:Uncharacterized protein n=1 Tax=Noviherbaspirillum pedocola TaxID=2801341 RepID=A0A934SXI4_9BURK|nr:hypothetical protein [Noviherbaspirillum pedocola]MBK4737572.1 hypothetical protein [Noviherbaspirillum pedocola]